ncbi:hypothetical protein ACFL3T_03430 [Patescibacteria group bacterium]
MIEPSQLEVGMLVWWTRHSESYGGNWDCPCVVTKVGDETFRVISLDDLKETKDLLLERPECDDPAAPTEMRISTRDEVNDYVQDQIRAFEDHVTKAERKLRDAKTALERYQSRAPSLVQGSLTE